jgi:hypothetical protein
MRNPLANGRKFRGPCSYSQISNPLKNGGKAKKIWRQHDELLRKTGARPLKNPLV